jgi:23S rRNA pseudouridine1911/1915/1917 synthase
MTIAAHAVNPRAAGERLDVYLVTALGRPRSQVAKLFDAGLVTVSGKPQRPSYKMRVGDHIEVADAPAPAASQPAPELPLLYEDDDIIVVDKPAGLAVHPGAASHTTATVADFARTRTTDEDPDRPGIVHRLDRDTSGILIIAKHPEAKAYMQAQFKARQVHKIYQLLVVGRIAQEEAVIKLPLGRDPAKPLQQAVQSGGREATTAYQTKRNFSGYTQIEARPQTGRTHQLRVHFSALGHPVAGDIVYGPPKRPLGLKRQFLHASDIEFKAPSGQLVSLHSPLPPDLTTFLEQLEVTEAAK